MKAQIIALLNERGVTLQQIAEIAYVLQKPYIDTLDLDQCILAVQSVLGKREVQHTLLTGIALDMLAEQDQLPEPLLTLLKNDEALYGIDEVLVLGITNLYGTIALTSFGYLDKIKPGIIGVLDGQRGGGKVQTFLDDLVAGIAAAASAKLAHGSM